jgi:hypothetical protein
LWVVNVPGIGEITAPTWDDLIEKLGERVSNADACHRVVFARHGLPLP